MQNDSHIFVSVLYSALITHAIGRSLLAGKSETTSNFETIFTSTYGHVLKFYLKIVEFRNGELYI